MLSPHDCSVNSSVLLSSGLPLPPRGSICGAPPLCSGIACPRQLAPWSGQQPENVGGVPGGGPAPNPLPLPDRGLSVELPGSFPGPRPMTGRLRMLPIIRLTEHKGPRGGLAGPAPGVGAWGLRVPTPEGRAVPRAGRGRLSHAGRIAISSSLSGRQRQREAGRGLVTGEGGRPLGALTPYLEVYLPPPHPATPSRASILGDGMLQNPEKGPPPGLPQSWPWADTHRTSPAAPGVCS